MSSKLGKIESLWIYKQKPLALALFNKIFNNENNLLFSNGFPLNFLLASKYPNTGFSMNSQNASTSTNVDVTIKQTQHFFDSTSKTLGYICNPLGITNLTPWNIFLNNYSKKINSLDHTFENLKTFSLNYVLLGLFITLFMQIIYGSLSLLILTILFQSTILYLSTFFLKDNSSNWFTQYYQIITLLFLINHLILWISYLTSYLFGFISIKIIILLSIIIHASFKVPHSEIIKKININKATDPNSSSTFFNSNIKSGEFTEYSNFMPPWLKNIDDSYKFNDQTLKKRR